MTNFSKRPKRDWTREEMVEYITQQEAFKGEKWRWLQDFRIEDESIAVSNYARGFSFIDGRFLTDQGENQDYMYWYINSWENRDCPVTIPIHKAVAETWCEKPDIPARLVIDHIDGDKHNNQADNLRYITYKENSNAQDVQKRKAESIHKTAQHRKEVETLTQIIQSKNEEIEYWRGKYYELLKSDGSN